MGEARRRGNFEERKAQAIAAGRVKGEKTFVQKSSTALSHLGMMLDATALMQLLGVRERGTTRAKRRGR